MKKGLIMILIALGIFMFGLAGVYALPENVFQNATGNFVHNCTNLNESGVYILNQSVSAQGSCFNITTDNVTLNGNGHVIVFNLGGIDNSRGILIGGERNNITISNFNNGTDGILDAGSGVGNNIDGIFANVSINNSQINNNIIWVSGVWDGIGDNQGISLGDVAEGSSINTSISNNRITTSYGVGISLLYLDLFNYSIQNNTIFSGIGSTGGRGDGILFGAFYNGVVFNNTVISYGEADIAFNVGGSTLSNNFSNNNLTTLGAGADCIYLQYSRLDIISGNNLICGRIGVDIFSVSAGDLISENNINARLIGIFFYSSSKNTTILNNYIVSGTDGIYMTCEMIDSCLNNSISYLNVNGEIFYTKDIFNVDSSLKWMEDIVIESNTAYLNSSAIPNLNISATISFYDLPTTMINPQILKDGVVCSDCYNFTSLNAGNVTFNVSSWSSYTIGYGELSASPVVNIFSVANSTSTSRTVTYNVSDDSAIANCSVYLNSALSSSNGSVINKSSNNSISLSGLGVGSYNVSVSCTDEWSLVGNSSNVTFVVSAVVEESSSGGDSGAMTLNVPSTSLVNGFSRNLGRGDGFKFNLSGQMHNLTLNSFNNLTANVTIRSTPQNFLVKINESVLVDVNSDGIKDLEVSYKKYFTSVAEIKIKAVIIQENNASESNILVNNTVVGESTDVDFTIEKEFSIWKIILAVLILVIAFIVYSRFR